jgi:Ankyrin repeats (3 copies)
MTAHAGMLDGLFQQAVSAIDAGDVATLERLLAAHPRLVRDRLDSPGAWLRDKVGNALDGFFKHPYLLWFVAEDPVRNGKLPKEIGNVARTIIGAAQREGVDSFQEQIDHALRLVCWSWIARECGVQIELIDVLLDAGASPDGRTTYEGRYGTHGDAAICNRNYAAAEHLLTRGASLTLTTALCLRRWDEVDQLARGATLEGQQSAFVQAAMNGQAEALSRMLALGMSATTVSARNQSHATAVHHAVWSGSVEAVKVLVDAGADLTRRDSIYDGTPLDWAKHGEETDAARVEQYREIVAYLREHVLRRRRMARFGRQVDDLCRAPDQSRTSDGFEIAFKHDFPDGTVVDARFQMTWVVSNIFQVFVSGSPVGHGYVFDSHCHYHLEIGKAFVEASYRVGADMVEVFGSSTRNAEDNYIAWREILRRADTGDASRP